MTSIRCLCFIVGELQFIVPRLFVMDVTCITSFEGLDLAYEDEATASGDMEDLPAYTHTLGVERECSAEFDLIKRLCGWSERFVNLPSFCVSDSVFAKRKRKIKK